jgi:TM2 domain-containing membrane protein YozV
MNCVNHSDTAAVAYCRTCGKALCNACSRNVSGVVYCENCLAERVHGAPSYSQVVAEQGLGLPPNSPHAKPALAGFLGLIPGVGAMYNGQFMKGIIHVGIFVVLIGLADHFGPIMVPVFFAYFFYCVFDAYKTAFAIEFGLPLPDPFGLEAMFGTNMNQTAWQRPVGAPGTANPTPGASPQDYEAQQQAYAAQAAARGQSCGNGVPIGAVVLIGLGCLFLLDNMGWFSFSLDRFWPVILIVIGAWMFIKRWTRRVS